MSLDIAKWDRLAAEFEAEENAKAAADPQTRTLKDLEAKLAERDKEVAQQRAAHRALAVPASMSDAVVEDLEKRLGVKMAKPKHHRNQQRASTDVAVAAAPAASDEQKEAPAPKPPPRTTSLLYRGSEAEPDTTARLVSSGGIDYSKWEKLAREQQREEEFERLMRNPPMDIPLQAAIVDSSTFNASWARIEIVILSVLEGLAAMWDLQLDNRMGQAIFIATLVVVYYLHVTNDNREAQSMLAWLRQSIWGLTCMHLCSHVLGWSSIELRGCVWLVTTLLLRFVGTRIVAALFPTPPHDTPHPHAS